MIVLLLLLQLVKQAARRRVKILKQIFGTAKKKQKQRFAAIGKANKLPRGEFLWSGESNKARPLLKSTCSANMLMN